MGVRAAGDELKPAFHQGFCQGLGIVDHLLLIGLERGLQGFMEGCCFSGDGVHQGAALDAGKHLAVDLFGILFLAEDDASPGAAQGLVGGGGHHIRVGNGVHVQSGGDQSGDVSHIHHELGAHLVGDLAEAGEVHLAGIGGSACQDHLGLVFQRHLFQFVIVELLGGFIHLIVDDIVELAAE